MVQGQGRVQRIKLLLISPCTFRSRCLDGQVGAKTHASYVSILISETHQLHLIMELQLDYHIMTASDNDCEAKALLRLALHSMLSCPRQGVGGGPYRVAAWEG